MFQDGMQINFSQGCLLVYYLQGPTVVQLQTCFSPRDGVWCSKQKGLLHAGLHVEGAGAKYIAQAGLLRAEPTYTAGALSVFKYGPGLES